MDDFFSLTDEQDHEILMHRDAHFGKSFEVMLAYYEEEEHLGVNPDFDIERIAELMAWEAQLGEDLSPHILSDDEQARVAKSQEAYHLLRTIFEVKNERSPLPRLIADLILSEDEERETEINNLLALKERALPELLSIIKTDEMYDPLFPGYGWAPYYAVKTIAALKSTDAIIPLFEMLGKETQFGEAIIVEALAKIGAPAQEFLLKLLKGRPITKDNIHAAYALSAFPEDEKIAESALTELEDPQSLKKEMFANYLIALLTPLSASSKERLRILMPKLPTAIRDELHLLYKI